MTTMNYDGHGRLRTRRLPHENEDSTFEYEQDDTLKSMTDGSGTTTFRYDMLSRLEWEEREFTGLDGAHRLTYGYNLANSVTSITTKTKFLVNAATDLKEIETQAKSAAIETVTDGIMTSIPPSKSKP